MVLSKPKTVKKRNLVSYTHPECTISEQFRTIKANLRFLMDGQNAKTFLITSPCSGEGKSVTCANLAVSMALQKEKVLLIDSNLRSPIFDSIFKISNKTGLSDVLNGKTSFEDAVNHTEIGRLDILTSGTFPHNPGELLGSEMMSELLDTAMKNYDVILLDSYAVLDAADTKLLANKCDGVILVLQNGKTTNEKAAETKKELEFSKAKLIGVILNER